MDLKIVETYHLGNCMPLLHWNNVEQCRSCIGSPNGSFWVCPAKLPLYREGHLFKHCIHVALRLILPGVLRKPGTGGHDLNSHTSDLDILFNS